MKSIRGRITTWMLVGLTLLWIAGGAAIYLTARSAMLARIDTEIQGLARQVRFMSRGGGGIGHGRHEESPTFSEVIPEDVYFQVWTLDGEVKLRSENLGKRDLPRLEVTGEESAFSNRELDSGGPIRVTATQFAAGRGGGRREGRGPGGGGGNEPVLVVVAKNLAGFENESGRLLVGLGITGLAAAAGSALLLALALQSGLRPLRKLGEAVATVDASSLDARFGIDGMPRELQPIAAHLDALMARLGESFQRERRFSADLAHELRTPISELRVMADLSLEWPTERTEEQMRNIREVATRMEKVVDTLLQLARLESEGESPHQPVALRKVLEEAWRPHVPLAEKRALQVEFRGSPDATMPGDPDLWRHVIGNLLANAAEYATEGGRIVVDSGNNSLRVANSVNGLSVEQAGRMFDRFWRADASRTGAVHSGLGLSLAKACTEAMSLEISASLGEGPEGEDLLVVEVGELGSNK